MVNIVIRTVSEFEAAIALIQKLSGAPEGTPEEARLVMLIAATQAWIRRHRQKALVLLG
jgi:hypothetical protein